MAFEATVQIPEGVTISQVGTRLVVTGPKGTLERDMRFPGIVFAIEDGQVTVSTEKTASAWSPWSGRTPAHPEQCPGVSEGVLPHEAWSSLTSPSSSNCRGDPSRSTLLERAVALCPNRAGLDGPRRQRRVTLTGIDKEKVATRANIDMRPVFERDPPASSRTDLYRREA